MRPSEMNRLAQDHMLHKWQGGGIIPLLKAPPWLPTAIELKFQQLTGFEGVGPLCSHFIHAPGSRRTLLAPQPLFTHLFPAHT